MSSLVLYFGFIAIVATGRKQGNDSLNTSADVENVTTKAKAKSAYNKVTNCHLSLVQNEIKKIIQLSNSDSFNIIDLHLFNGSTNNDELFTDTKFALVNPFGQEILYTLDNELYNNNYGTWALNVGRKSFDIHVEGSSRECIKNATNVAESILKQIVLRKENPENFKICIQYQHDIWHEPRIDYLVLGNYLVRRKRAICSCLSDNNAKNLKYKWHNIHSILHETVFLVIVTYLSIPLFLHYTALLAEALLYHTVFDITHPDYHTLQESTMSLSFIILKIVWREKGLVISLIRRVVLFSAFSYHIYLSTNVFTYNPVFMLFAFLPLIYLGVHKLQKENEEQRLDRLLHSETLLMYNFILTLICNKTSHKGIFNWMKSLIFSIERSCMNLRSCRNRVSSFFFKCVLYIVAALIFPVFFLLIFTVSAFFSSLFALMLLLVDISQVAVLKYSLDNNLSNGYLKHLLFLIDLLTSLLPVIFCSFLFNVYFLLTFSLLSLLLGLFLNLSHFIPYLASFSVLIFYGYGYWASLEEKYFVLKFLIYKTCLDEQRKLKLILNHNRNTTNSNQVDDVDVANDNNLNTNPGQDDGDVSENIDDDTLSVVSKDLYKTIRKRLLPYNENLNWTVLKLILLTVISYGIYELLQVLHQFNITSSVQLLITACISIAPKLFDT